MRTCYYELLEVDHKVPTEEIKKAYRRKALEWHPDKNYHRVEEATEKFALIQEAYEVLSDFHERAWYDGHRDAILREGKFEYDDIYEENDYYDENSARGRFRTTVQGTRAEDIMRFITAACYRGFDDSAKGFYTVYRTIFQKLADEEADAFAHDRGEDADDFYPYPSFGDSTISFDSFDLKSGNPVKNFYTAWMNFSTQKSFRWFDKYRISEAPDRFIKRTMEKENKKSRDLARKEYNDTVLTLVEFVKKRDPRYKALIEAAELRKEAQITEAKLKGIRERAEQVLNDEYFCVACNKSFKNENAWKNHEKSKKHVKNVELLKEEMYEEDEELISNVETDNSENELKFENVSSISQNGHQNINQDKRDSDEEEGSDPLALKKGFKKNKKQKKKQKTPNWGYADEEKLILTKEKSPKNGVTKDTASVVDMSESLEKTKINSRGGFESDEDSGTTPYFLKDEDNIDQNERETFQTRNKLFDHIKVTNHALGESVKSGKKKKKNAR
ncbi:1466_t:CDS:2 [Funneliformis geosporum]|uniref:1466_t:CDS:1 n=1 Tax=Funneliformis geosporum TaxID=1117311 RepID=A0A9W4SPI7_9GLOM|nr:1466_t:CDS:2 [Funneliformis geosporum]